MTTPHDNHGVDLLIMAINLVSIVLSLAAIYRANAALKRARLMEHGDHSRR